MKMLKVNGVDTLLIVAMVVAAVGKSRLVEEKRELFPDSPGLPSYLAWPASLGQTAGSQIRFA
jgi:hypothetical protein